MTRSALGAAVLAVAMSPSLAADEKDKPSATVDVSQGFLNVKSGDNSLTLGAWGQFRATVDDRESFDADATGTGATTEDGMSAAFSIARLRMYLQGTVYRPWLRYKVEIELANLKTDAVTNLNNGRVTDAYVEFAKSAKATLRAGQFKIPFGMQELVSDTRQEFVDRSITSTKFAPSRDVGLQLGGTFFEKKLGYQVAVVNGGGQNNPQDDEAFLYAARVVYDPFGEFKLVESATENPDGNLLHFGLAYRGGEVPRGLSSVGVFEDPDDETTLGAEVAWKYKRFFAVGEYFVQTDEQANPTVGPDIDANGFYAQLGVMIVPKTQEIAVRFAEIEPDESLPDATMQELRLVYGYFWKSHNMKLQADIGELSYGSNFSDLSKLPLRGVSPSLAASQRLVTLPGEEINDRQLRVQFVVAF